MAKSLASRFEQKGKEPETPEDRKARRIERRKSRAHNQKKEAEARLKVPPFSFFFFFFF